MKYCKDKFEVKRTPVSYLRSRRGLWVSAVLWLDCLDLLDEEVTVQAEFRHFCLQTVWTWQTEVLGSVNSNKCVPESTKWCHCSLLFYVKIFKQLDFHDDVHGRVAELDDPSPCLIVILTNSQYHYPHSVMHIVWPPLNKIKKHNSSLSQDERYWAAYFAIPEWNKVISTGESCSHTIMNG